MGDWLRPVITGDGRSIQGEKDSPQLPCKVLGLTQIKLVEGFPRPYSRFPPAHPNFFSSLDWILSGNWAPGIGGKSVKLLHPVI